MLFSHSLLDEILEILYHFNPLGYHLEREGSYDNEASLLFSCAYRLSPRPGVKISVEAIALMVNYIRVTFESIGHEGIDDNMYHVLAQTMLEVAQDIESNLQSEQHSALITPSADDELDAEEVDAKLPSINPLTKKWSVN